MTQADIVRVGLALEEIMSDHSRAGSYTDTVLLEHGVTMTQVREVLGLAQDALRLRRKLDESARTNWALGEGATLALVTYVQQAVAQGIRQGIEQERGRVYGSQFGAGDTGSTGTGGAGAGPALRGGLLEPGGGALGVGP